jgi:hypothetical protein
MIASAKRVDDAGSDPAAIFIVSAHPAFPYPKPEPDFSVDGVLL